MPMIFDTNTIKSQLNEANRDYMGRKTWENLYGSIDLAKQAQTSQLESDYASAISSAYASAYRNEADVLASNLGTGYKLDMISDIDKSLQEAYDSYRNNYLQGVSEIESNASEATANVTSALEQQTEYTKQFASKPYEYLQWLFDKYSEAEDKDNIFVNDKLWSRYTTVDPETNERQLKSWEDIANVGASEEYVDNLGMTQKEWSGMFDDQGNLTVKGAEFYDQMLNDFANRDPSLSFGNWLYNTDEELYNWAKSYDPYNYTEARTNLGSFQTMVGLTSKDQEYSFIERFGGLTENEMNNMYSEFTADINKLDKAKKGDDKAVIKSISNMTSQIEQLTERLGIKDDIEKQMNMTFSDLSERLANNVNKAKSKGEIWSNSITAGLSGAIMGGGMGASAAKVGTKLAANAAAKGALSAPLAGATAASSTIPVVGWIAAAIVAAASATYSGISKANEIKQTNKELKQKAKDEYTTLVANLVAYSRQKRRSAQQSFNI